MGNSVSVSAGFSWAKSKSKKTTDNQYSKTLLARYLYPRCDVFLSPKDLEPTPDFAAAVEEIRNTKSIVALRKLHQDFGQLFCKNVTLGGRLSSTKTIQATSTQTEEMEKQEFKINFGYATKADGTAIGVPVQASVGAKLEHSSGYTESKNTTEKNTFEQIFFEANGGDTILANNPGKWAATVGSPENWRVVNREQLSSLFETLSSIPGYKEVEGW